MHRACLPLPPLPNGRGSAEIRTAPVRKRWPVRASAITTTLVSLSALFLFGCDSPPDQIGEPPVLPPSIDKMSPEDINVTVVDGEGYQAALEKHKGKVLLVDYWATWCPTCLENFPHVVDLHNEHADDGLAVISISMDDPEEETAVREQLAEFSPGFEHLLSKFGSSDESVKAFEYDGGVPLYKLFDHEGNLRYQFSDFPDQLEKGEPVENLDKRVEELLAELPKQESPTEELPANNTNERE